MFVGHALLAFALAALVADWRGWPARRALTLGVVAGAFAAIPDVDVAYAVVALDLTGDALTRPSTFWDATSDAHRSVTHSLVVALLAGPAFGLWAVRDAGSPRSRAAGRLGGALVLAALVGVAVLTSGALGGFVMAVFAAAGLGVATLCRLTTDLPARIVAVVATAGLLSHPWGDLVTGEPPQLLYPFALRLFEGRVVLHADPTVHLLGAFALELAVIWLAVLALARVADAAWRPLLDWRAAVGVLYGVAAVAMAPPTLEVSYHFVFSILSVGLCCGVLVDRSAVRNALGRLPAAALPSPGPLRFAVTALAATTAALVGYALVYALVVAPGG